MTDAHDPDQTGPGHRHGRQGGPEVLADQLVEEVSIDGMCGVY